MQTLSHLDALRESLAVLKTRGQRAGDGQADVALVPTMGALHAGHIDLVRAARARARAVVVSIFVNPLQFGPNEDLDAYPRQPEADAALLAGEGVDMLWTPEVATMYPHGFATTVRVPALDGVLCGAARPGHFDGVATVVAKLFNQVQPDVALFGEKDWQQLAIIRRMARDLDLVFPRAGAIIGVPTSRAEDGLALSSRNQYLSPVQRQQAAMLPAAMRTAIAALSGGADAAGVLASLKATLLAAGFRAVDYAELRDAETLEPRTGPEPGNVRLFVAAHIGRARLIDNMAV